MTGAYQCYLESSSEHESQLKGVMASSPSAGGRGVSDELQYMQQELESLHRLKELVDSSDGTVNKLAAEFKELIESTSGSTGYVDTPLYSFIHLFIYLFIYLFICLFVCLFVCVVCLQG